MSNNKLRICRIEAVFRKKEFLQTKFTVKTKNWVPFSGVVYNVQNFNFQFYRINWLKMFS